MRTRTIDQIVGSRIQMLREQHTTSVSELAHALSIPSNVLEDYEAGKRRVAASHLASIALAFRVDVIFFFSDRAVAKRCADNTCETDPDRLSQTRH
ncbi:helix-turn-helix domain-containing protein [Acuticoccus kandeliae]|uniref:helix-turn-helix domain-containing protein n=1 Tax=Acuticoccus kandeliae TaxID=2073160 RepID=UPI000D3EC913